MADTFTLGGLFALAAITFAFEYYLGILLYTMPVLQRRTKGLGIGLMRESPNSLVFLLLVTPLAAFLAQFQGDINQTALGLLNSALDLAKPNGAIVQCQITIVNNTTLVGVAVLIAALAVAIARFILTGIPFNPLQIASTAASAMDTVAGVYAPISQLLGLAIVTQTTLAAFAMLMANNWTVFADIGVFLYIIPLRLTRRTATFLMTFGIVGYVLIPLYAQVQKFILDWLNAQPGWFNWALGVVCGGSTLQTAIIDVTAPVLYFGFLGWLSVGGMAGAGIRRITKKGFGGAGPLSAVTALRSSAVQAVSVAGRAVESTVSRQVAQRRARAAVSQAAADIQQARGEGRVIGLRTAEAIFDRAKDSLLTNMTKQARQFALRASEYALAAERPPEDDLSIHSSASAYMTTHGDEYFDPAASPYEPASRDEERSMHEEEFKIRDQIVREDLANARTPEQRLRAGKALTALQRQRIQYYTGLFGAAEINEDELRTNLANIVLSRRGKTTTLTSKQKDSVENIIEAEKSKLRKRARETMKGPRDRHDENPYAKMQAELDEQQRREEALSRATAEPQEDETIHIADEIFRQMHQKTEEIVTRGISHEPEHVDTAESRLDKFLRTGMKKPKKEA